MTKVVLAVVDSRGFLGSADIAMAVEGLDSLGYDVKPIEKQDIFVKDIDYSKYVLFLGGVNECRTVLRKMNAPFTKHIDTYPKSLRKFLGRDVKTVALREALSKLGDEMKPFFIKPIIPKQFPALVIRKAENISYGFLHIDENVRVYTSDVVDFKTEWRAYVWKKKVVGMYYYRGNWRTRPDIERVTEMVKTFKDAPVCYALDVGVVGKETVLVEANDCYAIGNYGLDFETYAKMLLDRWKELTTT